MLPLFVALRKLLTCPWDGRRRSRKGVSRVSNTLEPSILAAPQWRARLGASVLLASAPVSQRGIAMSGALAGTGRCSALAGVPAVTPMPDQLGQQIKPTSNQTHNYNYATGVDVNGVGASGPPRRRETA